MAKFQFKMADGRHTAKCWKCYNSPTNRSIWMKHGWSHPIVSPICLPWCGYHGNDRCLATAHWTFSNYGRLQTERVNQFWWNLVHNSKLGPRWQSSDQILKFLKFQMADGRHVGKYWKCHNSPPNGPIGTKLGWSQSIKFPTCPPWCGCHGNGCCLATAIAWQRRIEHSAVIGVWGHTREPILMKFGTQQQIKTSMTVAWSNIKIFKIPDGGRPPCLKILEMRTRLPMGQLGLNLGGRIQSTPLPQNCFGRYC